MRRFFASPIAVAYLIIVIVALGVLVQDAGAQANGDLSPVKFSAKELRLKHWTTATDAKLVKSVTKVTNRDRSTDLSISEDPRCVATQIEQAFTTPRALHRAANDTRQRAKVLDVTVKAFTACINYPPAES